MKRVLLTLFFGMLAFIACSGMFSLKYHVLGREHYLSRLQNEIQKNTRSIHILNAEWSNLTDPRRIRILMENTKLEPMKTSQVIEWSDIDIRYEGMEM